MVKKFKNKYRIPSARLQSWDYSRNGAYFITICTKNMMHYFGEISNGKILLSHIGVVADLIWYEIKNHTKNVDLGNFVIMPNHVHGILILKNNNNENHDNEFLEVLGESGDRGGGANCPDRLNRMDCFNQLDDVDGVDHAVHGDKACLVSTRPTQSVRMNANSAKTIGGRRLQNQGKNTISSIVGSYKSAVTKHARRLGYEFEWQSRFHEHIIRNQKAFDQIVEYILTNPQNWEKDGFYNNNQGHCLF